jgi:hypothetical protein
VVDPSIFNLDMTPRGWIVLEDVEPALPQLGEDVDLVTFLAHNNMQGTQFISGDELRKRAVVLKANYGQRDAEWLVKNQDKLPERPEGVLFIFFPGTVWKHPNGAFLIPYLFWTGEIWDMYFFWLTFGFSPRDRLVHFGK